VVIVEASRFRTIIGIWSSTKCFVVCEERVDLQSWCEEVGEGRGTMSSRLA
jgi:hypothetical protein